MPTLARIPVVALHPLSTGAVLWRRSGVLQVTVIVKATFAMVHQGDARPLVPSALVLEDRYASGGASLVEAHDLAPYLPNAGVVLSGAACSPAPVPAMTIRLAVYRDRPLIEKVAHVFGDRPAGAASPIPFQRMPLAWERTTGGPASAENPAGIAPDSRALANFVHPADPRRPAGFGPVSSRWGSRLCLLAGRTPPALDEPGEAIPEGLDYRWFQAAPVDQQCEHLAGDEWIVLDGLHPTLPRVQTRLPGVRAQAAWVAAGPPRPLGARLVSLCADTLVIDGERQRCSLVWRGCFAVDHPEALASLRVFAGLSMPGHPLAWPDEAREAGAATVDEAPVESRASDSLPTEKMSRDPLPFAPGAVPVPSPSPSLRRDRVGGATLEAPVAPFTAGPSLPFTPARGVPGAPLRRARVGGGTIEVPTSANPSGAGNAVPFRPPGPPAAVAPPAAPPRRDRVGGGTIEAAVPSPGEALPFHREPPHAPAAPALQPVISPPPAAAPPHAPAVPLVWGDDDPATRIVDPSSIMRPDAAAPFAISAAGTTAAAAPAVPGAPWSGVAAEAAPAPEPFSSTMALPDFTDLVVEDDSVSSVSTPRFVLPPIAPPPMASPPPVLPPIAPPPMASPPPVLPPIAPPPMASPPPVLPPIAPPPMASPPPVLPPIAPPPMASPPPVLPPAPIAPRAPSSGSPRDQLLAALAEGAPVAGLYLVDADLHGLDLTGARLAGVKLAGANLAGAKLDGADLAGADLSSAALAGASFRRAKLERARLDGARGQGVIFDEASLAEATAASAKLPQSSFVKASGEGSSWERATLDDARFDEAVFRRAKLTRASLRRARFERADLGGADLSRAGAEEADLRHATLDAAILHKADLSAARLEGASMRKVAAEKADLRRARLDGAHLEGAELRGALLADAVLAGAKVDGADMRNVDLQRADVSGVSLATANTTGADLRGVVG